MPLAGVMALHAASPGLAAGGGAYHLAGPDQPTLRGNDCCCTFLPLVMRNK